MHTPEVRSDPVRIEKLLHQSFYEIGYSGRGLNVLRDTLRFRNGHIPNRHISVRRAKAPSLSG